VRIGRVSEVLDNGRVNVRLGAENIPAVIVLYPKGVQFVAEVDDRVLLFSLAESATDIYGQLVEVHAGEFAAGPGARVATESQVSSLHSELSGHMHPTAGTGAPSPPSPPIAALPAGSQKVRVE
jgi:hypothetical protein